MSKTIFNKWTLILILTAATLNAAEAQETSFKFSGLVDVGAKITSNSNSALNKSEIINNNSGTSALFLDAARNIGAETKASIHFELDINPASSSSLSGANNNTQAYSGTPFQGEQYVSLTGRFGDVKLGTPNSAAFVASQVSEPLSTQLGSGYSVVFGRLGTAAISGMNQVDGNGAGRILRHEKSIIYTSPAYNGLKGSVEYAFGNDNSATVTSDSNTNTAISVQYSQGSLNAIYVFNNEKAGSNGASGPAATFGTTPIVSLPVNTDISWNMASANYNFGTYTLYAGLTTTKHNAPVPLEDSSSWNVAGKYALNPDIDLMANYLVRSTKLANTSNATLIGLGMNYYLDKQTNLYGRYENQSFDANGTAKSTSQSIWAFGIRYLF